MEELIGNGIIEHFVSQGILGILVIGGAISVYKLLQHIEKKSKEHEARVDAIIDRHEKIREASEQKFVNAIEKVELNVKNLIDEFRNLMRK